MRIAPGGREATIAPADIAADKLLFAFPDALVGVPMDTELTFEITFGEIHKEKSSTLVGEQAMTIIAKTTLAAMKMPLVVEKDGHCGACEVSGL